MKLINVIVGAASALVWLAGAQPAAAQTVVPLAKFRSVELNGGGVVRLRHGPVQRVTILKGSADISGFEVINHRGRRIGRGTVVNSDAQLVIDVCKGSCNLRNYDLEVEIVTPNIFGLAVNGGGTIASRGAFPRQAAIGAAVRGGGEIDIRSLPVASVGAAIHGGGSILTSAERTLGAAVSGGGDVRYWGDPVVSTSINGGGTVRRGS